MLKDAEEIFDINNVKCNVLTKGGREYLGCNVVGVTNDLIYGFEHEGALRMIPWSDIEYVDYFSEEPDDDELE